MLEVEGSGGRGYRGGSLEIERRIGMLFDWLAGVHARGRRRGRCRRCDRRPRPLVLPSPPAGAVTVSGASEDAGESPREAAAAEPDELLGTVAIVGFPNVGKSTLINRLTASRAAVVHETSGTTRDRKELVCEWAGKRFLLIDTGGVDVASGDAVSRSIVDQARSAIEEADLVLLRRRRPRGRHARRRGARDDPPARARAGARAREQDRRSRRRRRSRSSSIGSGSATRSRSRGCTATTPATCSTRSSSGSRRAASGGRRGGDEAIRVAILGRPNVGKSSLFNALIGAERTIVSEVPGTTRDAIDTVLVRDGRVFQLIDTAGLRRKRRQRQGIEYYSELRALEAAERADVALVLIDAEQGIVEGDLAAADVARKAQCSTLIVLSKWDRSKVTIEDVRPELQRRLRQRPPFITTSATTGRGDLARARQGRRAVRQARGPDHDGRAEPLPRRAARRRASRRRAATSA